MKLYNTLTKQIETFKPYNKDYVTMYTCGPTVYNFAHIGNLRTYIFEDVLEKTLEYIGYTVKRVMNITDVGHLANDSDDGDDKMLIGAKRENKTVLDIAEYYTDAFFKDTEKLNIRKPETVEKATDHIDEYIKMIDTLLEKNIAYKSNGNIYFDITKASDYYKLSGKKEEDLIIGARDDVTQDDAKRNPFDFGLWFTSSKFEDQALKWDTKYGVGYPGWHIECSAIALEYLGEHLDIHCGAVDNVFPHHTNEIAQTEACIGHKWCNFWIHGEHLNEESGKMSKSNGEFLTVTLLEEKGYNPIAYRFFCLKSHYRNQLIFSYENLDQATNEYNKLVNKVKLIKTNLDGVIENNQVVKYQNEFKKALQNDLNTSSSLTVLFDLIKDEELNNSTKFYLINDFDYVLSLDLSKEKEIDEELKKYIEEKIEERKTAKENKNYALADEIREELKNKGIIIKDSRDKTEYELI